MSLPETTPDSSGGEVIVESNETNNVRGNEKDCVDLQENVQDLNENDVFLGRGGNLWRKEGNHRLRNLCLACNQRYNNVQKTKKPAIARAIVGKVKAMNPPGRFLKKRSEIAESSECSSFNNSKFEAAFSWVEVNDDVAAEKVSQVFRDIRRQRRTSNSTNVTDAITNAAQVTNNATAAATNNATREMFIGATTGAPAVSPSNAAGAVTMNDTIAGMGRTSSVAGTNERSNINATVLPQHPHPQSTVGFIHPFLQQPRQQQHYPYDSEGASSMLNKVQMTRPVPRDDTCDSTAPDRSSAYFSLNSATTYRGQQMNQDEHNSFDAGSGAVGHSLLQQHSPHHLNNIDHEVMRRRASLFASSYPQHQTFQPYGSTGETEQDIMYRRHQHQQQQQTLHSDNNSHPHGRTQSRGVLSLLYGRNNIATGIATTTDRIAFPNQHISPTAAATSHQYHSYNNNYSDVTYSNKNRLHHDRQQQPGSSTANMEFINQQSHASQMMPHHHNLSQWYRYQNNEENDTGIHMT